MITQTLLRRADNFRRTMETEDGVVLLYNDIAEGWGLKLPRPTAWKPGTIAIATDGCAWRAEGGDDYHGAERWTPIAKENAA